MSYEWGQEPNQIGKNARGRYGKVNNLESRIHQPLFTTCEEVGFLPGFHLEGV